MRSSKQHLQHLHYSKINALKENPKPKKSKAKKATRWQSTDCINDAHGGYTHILTVGTPTHRTPSGKERGKGRNVQHVQNVGKSSPKAMK